MNVQDFRVGKGAAGLGCEPPLGGRERLGQRAGPALPPPLRLRTDVEGYV
jgi:hypothetical protein